MPLTSGTRIKILAQKQIEFVVGNRQLAEHVGGFLVHSVLLYSVGRSAETQPQCDMFIFVAKFSQELPHFFRLKPSCLNQPQRYGGFRFTGRNTFQQSAVKCATMFWAIRVNPAMAAVERSARLEKFPNSGFCFFRFLSANAAQCQTERLKLFRVIAALQLHVGEDDAIATKAAGETKFFSN
jgi:hypothetical protein